MSNSAYIKLVPGSTQQSISLDEVKKLFHYYKEITSKTGAQVSWSYSTAAFPYELKEKPEGKDQWFYLKSDERGYNMIVVGVGSEQYEDENGEFVNREYIQIVLPEGATHGDKGKGNEFSKFLGQKLEGELHLFNGRVMYYYKRK
ncbi:DUF1885 family protein [Bacillus suaedaesalsae]|uniref:DUF1885 family protein n=1 Tax=Bacillus suaedaesalsae TaxID=2810349 RepID=A0ABS2DJJ5_9BACI|nr:DUF1885 family protein [Bacillus suaedaesalsae]MBM6618618.1 DUF1885 family protein [Bacillus suaedaesalsae]